jgi:hypothetical protein
MASSRWTLSLHLMLVLALFGCAPAIASGDGDAPPPPGAPGASGPGAAIPTAVTWSTDLAAARVRAREAERPLAIVFR